MAYKSIVEKRLEKYFKEEQISFESNRLAEYSTIFSGVKRNGSAESYENGASSSHLNQIKRKSQAYVVKY